MVEKKRHDQGLDVVVDVEDHDYLIKRQATAPAFDGTEPPSLPEPTPSAFDGREPSQSNLNQANLPP